MIPTSIARLTAHICRALPKRFGASVYYRVLSRFDWGVTPYKNVPLAFAPQMLMNLMPGDSCHGSIAFAGYYELGLTRRITRLAREEGGLLIDAGANYGYYSLLWTANGASNNVIAIEASPRNFPHLVANLEGNAVRDRVIALNEAVGETTGTVAFKMSDPSQSGWDKIASDATESNWQIPITTLDQVVGDRTVSVLKIDCEGYEHQIIRGARQLIESRRARYIFFEENPECSSRYGIQEGEVKSYLIEAGYQFNEMTGPHEYEACLIP